VLVVGGGPAGIAAAVSLRRAGQRVTVVEREAAVGGIARHSHHTGYGLVEFRRLMRGPAYARAWARAAASAGVDVRTETTATGWHGDDATGRILELTSPAGIQRVEARAVILATGTRERPRAARLVPGSRPTGVLTTGALQQLVTLHHLDVGRHAVVVGAEHVSFSAILTLARARCSTVAIVTPESRHQTHPLLALATARRHRVPVLTGATVSRIVGSPRVEAVEITDAGGDTYRIECDTVVFTGDWTPDHELARRGGVVIDPLTRAPRVDTGLRTSTPGVFAAGNLLHGAESAAVCARSGAWVATAVRSWLAEPQWWPAERAVPIECAPPLRWISPSAVVPGDRAVPHGHFLARTACFAPRPTVVVRQGQRDLWRGRIRSTVPNRPVHLPAEWLSDVEPGEAVRIEFAP
jgi:thioredoxin reductase